MDEPVGDLGPSLRPPPFTMVFHPQAEVEKRDFGLERASRNQLKYSVWLLVSSGRLPRDAGVRADRLELGISIAGDHRRTFWETTVDQRLGRLPSLRVFFWVDEAQRRVVVLHVCKQATFTRNTAAVRERVLARMASLGL